MKKMSAAHLAEKIAQHSEADPADFSNADLRERDLSRSELPGADFTNANARGCDLSGCDLRGTNWTDANLRFADFSGADLSASVLDYADMTGANMSEAKLAGASMVGTTLPGTRVTTHVKHKDDDQSWPDMNGFPRIWLMMQVRGDGRPILTNGVVGAWREDYLKAFSKFHVVDISDVPFTDVPRTANFDIIRKMRGYNPRQKINWYTTGPVHIEYTLPGNLWTEQWDLCRGASGPAPTVVHYQGGGKFPASGLATIHGVNLHPVRNEHVALLRNHFAGSGVDGVSFDFAIGRVSVIDPTGGPTDFAEFGYADIGAMDTATTEGLRFIMAAMQSDWGFVQGNRGTVFYTSDAVAHSWDGETMETWDPDHGANGGQPPGGTGGPYDPFDLAMNVALFYKGTDPTGNGKVQIKVEVYNSPGGGPDPAWRKGNRFAMASACIAGGVSTCSPNASLPALEGWNEGGGPSPVDPYYCFQWGDEYAVDLSGTTDLTGKYMGWLGRPRGFETKTGTAQYKREFTNGIVLLNGDGVIPHSFTLDRPYKRIKGFYDPVLHDGSIVSGSVTVPGKDGMFLLRQ